LITNFEIRDEESEYEIDNDSMEPNALQTNEPPNKRSKNAQGASSGMEIMHASLISYSSLLFFTNIDIFTQKKSSYEKSLDFQVVTVWTTKSLII